jgi:NAD(P)-dependent dehydrogenase (short-subunit alcohol dehydrogenase family)
MTHGIPHAAPSAAITGAGSGLGREIAIGFADRGHAIAERTVPGAARGPSSAREADEPSHAKSHGRSAGGSMTA